jgi:predicted DsbA family dithiol-disulfide isomerase
MRQMTIDFVSDVSCPWCAIGLESLLRAAQKLQDEVTLDLRFQPFELNPAMGPEGQDIGEHLQQKYGASDEQAQRTRELIAARGADVGFVFRMDRRSRIYNTFDAHRLLHWAGGEGRQLALKQALFRAYFTEGESPASHEVLVRAAVQAGLDAEGAHAVLAGSRFAAEVREREQFYHQQGIHSVPAIIVNGRHLIQGGQPPEVFEQALRQLASEA